jgi:Tol biopolymer transport system component
VGILLVILFSFCIKTQQKNFPILKGPYLGQKPPGMTPEIFSPDIISSGCHDLDIAISPDGKEIFFTRSGLDWFATILYLKKTENGWQGPMLLPFNKFDKYKYPFVSPDGKSLLFEKRGPASNGLPGNLDIFISEKTRNGWGEPSRLDNGINTENNEGFISMASNGNLYFGADYPHSRGRFDIYMFAPGKEGDSKVTHLENNINSESGEFHAYVAPDESYLIFDSQRPGGFGQNDLYISFRKIGGKWTKAINMGDRINTPFGDMRPFVSYDRKYFFFCSNRPNPRLKGEKNPLNYKQFMKRINGPGNGSQDIYWVDAKIIDDIKSKELK